MVSGDEGKIAVGLNDDLAHVGLEHFPGQRIIGGNFVQGQREQTKEIVLVRDHGILQGVEKTVYVLVFRIIGMVLVEYETEAHEAQGGVFCGGDGVNIVGVDQKNRVGANGIRFFISIEGSFPGYNIGYLVTDLSMLLHDIIGGTSQMENTFRAMGEDS